MTKINNLNKLIHYCYQITNLINNKIYIGVTYKNIEDRLKEHFKFSKSKSINKTALGKAIIKYGAENFKIKILKICKSRQSAFDQEKLLIKKYKSTNYKFGYNQTKGGDSGPIKIQLDKKLILNILNYYCDNNFSLKEISKHFNINYHTIFDITRLRFSATHNIPYDLINKVIEKKKSSKMRKKVNKSLILNIINDYAYNNYTMANIANKYNLSLNNVWNILNRNTFKNIQIDKILLKQLNKVIIEKSKRKTNARY